MLPQFERFSQDPIFLKLNKIACQTGESVYAIGGFVRDLLLGRDCKDIDIVVEGSGVDLARLFGAELNASDVVIYERYGTAMVRVGDYEIEFVGARKESYSRDSRNPVVEEGSLEDDQNRRDFTINALSISLNSKDYGLLVDPFGGVEDLKSGIIRTPLEPGITFSDDPLRMMRAIRFATQLNFKIREEVFEAIKKNKKRLKIISQERITTELNKIIMSKHAGKGFKMLFASGLLAEFFPEMVALHGVDIKDGRAHKDNFFHTVKVLENLIPYSNDLWLRWSAILHDIAKPKTKRFHPVAGWTFHGHEELGARMVPRIFKRLKLPLDSKMKFVEKMVRLHLRPIALVNEVVTDSAIRRLIVDAGEDITDLMQLCRADITTRDKSKLVRFLKNFDFVEDRVKEVTERDNLRNWQPPVTGAMIMAHFGIGPCKAVGDIKGEIREAILEGQIPNETDAALALMKEVGLKYIKQI